MQNYVDNVWLSCSFRWAKCMRKRQVLNIVDTNNGVEAQNKAFKYEYLPRSLDKSVFGIAVLMVETYVPDSRQKYLQRNVKLSGAYRRYNSKIPSYLHDRPPHFIKHCLKAKFSSGDLRESDVLCVDMVKGIFSVRSSLQHSHFHEVNLEEPKCTCEQWEKFHYPCKHFFGVFNFFDEEWSFDSLPSHYRNSVFVTLDNGQLEIAPKLDESVSPKRNEDEVRSTGDCQELRTDDEEDIMTDDLPAHISEDDATKDVAENKGDDKVKRAMQEKAKCIADLTYLVDNVTVLNSTLDALENVAKAMDASCTKREGLPIRQSPKKRKLKLNTVEYHKVFHSKLPSRKRFKRQTKTKSKKSPQSAVSIDLAKDDDFQPPLKHRRPGASDISALSTLSIPRGWVLPPGGFNPLQSSTS